MTSRPKAQFVCEALVGRDEGRTMRSSVVEDLSVAVPPQANVTDIFSRVPGLAKRNRCRAGHIFIDQEMPHSGDPSHFFTGEDAGGIA